VDAKLSRAVDRMELLGRAQSSQVLNAPRIRMIGASLLCYKRKKTPQFMCPRTLRNSFSGAPFRAHNSTDQRTGAPDWRRQRRQRRRRLHHRGGRVLLGRFRRRRGRALEGGLELSGRVCSDTHSRACGLLISSTPSMHPGLCTLQSPQAADTRVHPRAIATVAGRLLPTHLLSITISQLSILLY
jgi:hypothetical protein